MSEPIVTIVTVCRNASDTVREAIGSVLCQKWHAFEYLVLDGASTDNTYDIVQSYDAAFAEKGIAYRHISEPDGGIFDAMNKAADMAKGEWICYINADDRLHDADTLGRVFADCGALESYDVIYGDTVYSDSPTRTATPARAPETLPVTMPFCHQASFTRCSVLRERRFDQQYRVADYNFFLRLFKDGGRFLHMPVTVADYSLDGFSNQNKYKTYLSTLDVKHDLGMLNKYSARQRLKNIYFKALLTDSHPLHTLARAVDAKISRRAK